MLKVLAVTAPHWVAQRNIGSSMSLNSKEPYSLYNAVRYAAHLSQVGSGEWGGSNWNTKEGCNQGIMLYEYFENQKQEFIEILNRVQPNLVFIGSMTIGFAGAIEVGKIIKHYLGDKCFTVIGGKHIIETTYLTNGVISVNDNCCLNLMKMGKIPKVFDLVISGDGEEVIVEIGNIIGALKTPNSKNDFYFNISALKNAKGDWLAAWLSEDNIIYHIQSDGLGINYDMMPSPISVFGIKSNFPVFQSEITAHTYSYMSKGCPFNCFFCSERNAINGKLKQVETAPQRLFNQFKELHEYGEKNGIKKISAFVEDSVLLAGKAETTSYTE
ncbi:MAG: hypothetical protein V9E88_00890 [Ferruginibacter sp.]